MGKACSKADVSTKQPGQVDHQKVEMTEEKPGTASERDREAERKKVSLRSQSSHTKSGFQSDIQTDKKSMANNFAYNNTRKLHEVYDTADGAVLGRGACGTVSIVKRKDTGELYAMKQVALDGMTGGTIEELRKEIDIQRGLTHPNICRLFESFEENGMIHIIMEVWHSYHRIRSTIASQLSVEQHLLSVNPVHHSCAPAVRSCLA